MPQEPNYIQDPELSGGKGHDAGVKGCLFGRATRSLFIEMTSLKSAYEPSFDITYVAFILPLFFFNS